jgi:hypothetical protein
MPSVGLQSVMVPDEGFITYRDGTISIEKTNQHC